MGSHGKSTPRLALIGGTGLDAITGFEPLTDAAPVTAFGPASAPLASGRLGGLPVLFLARHGTAHSIPPHAINYRANIAALREAGATHVVAVAAVGGIGPNCGAGALVVPDQLIDYTWGREHAFASTVLAPDSHFDFTEPYCAELRAALLAAGAAAGVALVDGGVYGATQGPRLETAAEIRRLARDGCDLVGMTGMPEAALAREAGLCYATLAVVSNRAAGLGGEITMDEIHGVLASAMHTAGRVLEALGQGWRRKGL
ncbi:MAG: S-methyl-5'-thioinosine phosphorylase [Chromatiales bacterium]|nr:S-methyl-5'-thioinosine phosphorylase [Chromatiales bacterium]